MVNPIKMWSDVVNLAKMWSDVVNPRMQAVKTYFPNDLRCGKMLLNVVKCG